MWILYSISLFLFLGPMIIILFYALLIYLLSLLIGLFTDSRRVALYARNIALSVTDQGIATFLGQAPDISISEALGLARIMHEQGTAKVSKFVLKFGDFVDWLFWNKFWKIEENHIKSSIDQGESWKNTITHWHFSDADTNTRYVKNNKVRLDEDV